jgi:hypothetical protein
MNEILDIRSAGIPSEVDYDGIGPCPFCNSRIDEFNYCACGGNLGVG